MCYPAVPTFRPFRSIQVIDFSLSQVSCFSKSRKWMCKYTEALTNRSLINPLAGVDPVLAAAAAAAVMNAGLIPQSTSSGVNSSSTGTTSQNSAAAVAAVAAAAMNAAAMAAALGAGNTGKQLGQTRKPYNAIRPTNRRSTESFALNNLRSKRYVNLNRASREALSVSDRERELSPSQIRFPHHLDHRNPEDDPTATRTLFVGNLMPEITEEDLRSLFERYGFIEDIDIKRRDPGSGINAYAFIRYVNLDMAHRAKVEMSGQLIGQFTCKIGYGKVIPTRCLWIGGLGPWITYPEFANLLEEFGPTEKIIWPSGKNYAHALFPNTEMAITAADALRGYPLGGAARRIRVDFTDEAHMVRDPLKRRRITNSASLLDIEPRYGRSSFPFQNDKEGSSPRRNSRNRGKREYTSGSDELRDRSNNFPTALRTDPRKTDRTGRDVLIARRRNRPATPEDELYEPEPSVDTKTFKPPKPSHTDRPMVANKFTAQTATNIEQLASCLPTAWDGLFFLKSSSFPCRMHILRGDKSLVDQFMSSRAQSFPMLHTASSGLNSPVVSSSTCGSSKSLDEPGASVFLRITQRMKLDPTKLEDVSQRISSAGNSGFCVLLAVPSSNCTPPDFTDVTKQPQRPLRNLISYLRTKDSAGVVLLNPICVSDNNTEPQSVTGVLHAFPPCDFAFDLLRERAVSLQKEYTRDDHLVVLLIRSTGTM